MWSEVIPTPGADSRERAAIPARFLGPVIVVAEAFRK